MNKLTFKHLRYFRAVALQKHFGRAAEACAITQPAMSFQIKELEQILGQSLFERQHKVIELTPFGAEFLEQASPVLSAIDDLNELSRAWGETISGPLRLGFIPTIAPYLLPKIMPQILSSFPQADLQIKEGLTQTLLNDLTQRRLDLALVALPISRADLQEVPFFEEDFVLIRPEVDANKPIPDRMELQTMRLLLLEEGHCFRDQTLSFFHNPMYQSSNPQATTTPPPNRPVLHNNMEGSSLTTLVQMVAGGLGITLLPQMAVAVETASAQVCVQSFPSPAPSRTIGIVMRKNSPLSAHYTQIITMLKAILCPAPLKG